MDKGLKKLDFKVGGGFITRSINCIR